MKRERIFYLSVIATLLALCFTLVFSLLGASADETQDLRYDVNEDGLVTIMDVTDLLNYLSGHPTVIEPTAEEIVNMAYALKAGEALDKNYTLTGVVKQINTAYSTQYNNVTVTIVVGNMTDKPIQCFRMKGTGADTVKVGDTITVTGLLKNYNGTIEFDASCTLDKLVAGTVEPPTPTLDTPEEIVNALYALTAGEALDGTYTLSGKITRIVTAYSSQHKNVTVEMVVCDMTDKPVQCFRLKGEGADTLKVGDTITVNGTLKNYNGTFEFDSGCTLEKVEREPAVTVVETNVAYETLDAFCNRMEYTYGLNSTGDVEVLVIPVGFTNSNYTNVKETLEKALNGTPDDTGWHSLASYYEEVSYGKLHFHATITDVYETGKRYSTRSGNAGDECDYLAGALEYFDGQYDYSLFDGTGSGYIDCIYLIYLAPYDGNTELWWAYTTEFYEDENAEELRFDGVGVDWYMWFSYEFFAEDIYYDGETSDDLGVTINAETVIHETGHALGLDDYYDYVDDNKDYGGLGALNMMDYNQGDQDPFSKAILGWINPTVLKSGSYDATLTSFTTTGDALFLARNGNGTYFDEFFVIAFYTPDGVNELKAEYEIGLPSEAGVVVYHVNSTLNKNTNDVYAAYDIFACNNGAKTDRLIKIVEADNDGSIDDGYYCDNDDLFHAGKTLTLKWNDGTSTGWTLKVNSIDENGASISIIG